MPLNIFSDTWLAAFLDQRDGEATHREARFVAALIAPKSTVLDIPCGFGRHAAMLGTLGHEVIGIDRDSRMLSRARTVCAAVQADMRRLPFAPNSFDVALNMWQSFGYFSAQENTAILADLARVVRPGGLLILDLHTRALYENVTGKRRLERAGIAMHETTVLIDDRARVTLAREDGSIIDEFEWQVFTPHELQRMGAAAGWTIAGQFTDFDTHRPADDGSPRIQYVFSR